MAENEWLGIILRAVYRRHKKVEVAKEEIERAMGVKLAAAFEEGHREGLAQAAADEANAVERPGENFGGDVG